MSKLSQLALNDEGFVFDPTTGDSYQASGTAIHILQALRAGKDGEEVARALALRYGVNPDEVLADVVDFMGCLKYFGLV